MGGSITDVHCPNCGAPAKYDIVRHNYRCASCGGQVKVSEALAEKQGFRRLQQEKIRESAGRYKLMTASCSGCGAELVFEEGEAAVTCAFCGRALVRKDYVTSKEIPELILPFRITRDEAEECLRDWCSKNQRRPEAKRLMKEAGKLNGFYLPYELIRGPVSSAVSRIDALRYYHCRAFVDDVYVNCSGQLDNLLLDAMEPYETEELMPFDFAYAAGQRIRIRDINDKELGRRVDDEISSDITPAVRKTLETEAVEIRTDPSAVMRMPVLLPAYYLNAGGTLASVNGQTGRVSVRADKESYYFFLPWWLKALIATVVISFLACAAFRMFGMPAADSIIVTGVLAAFMLIVSLCAYSDAVHNSFRVEAARKIFTSSGGILRRRGKDLVRDAKMPEKQAVQPAFFENLDGKQQHVKLVFRSPKRIFRTALLTFTVMFLPVIIALFLNGFNFRGLELGGSAVWFCIMVPVIPVYILKFAVIELYERPWIYVIGEDGKARRYAKKPDLKKTGGIILSILKLLVIPPMCFAIWFGIISFFVMCYLTAFGFD